MNSLNDEEESEQQDRELVEEETDTIDVDTEE